MTIDEHIDEYRLRRYTILTRRLCSDGLDDICRRFLRGAGQGTWVAGDKSPHAWRESSHPVSSDILDLIPFRLTEQILGRVITRHVEWFNVYGVNQYIAGHRDAGGDAQLLVCVDLPQRRYGGQLWLCKRDFLLRMRPGDILLFEASKLLHGTTRITDPRAQRITLNVRLWTA